MKIGKIGKFGVKIVYGIVTYIVSVLITYVFMVINLLFKLTQDNWQIVFESVVKSEKRYFFIMVTIALLAAFVILFFRKICRKENPWIIGSVYMLCYIIMLICCYFHTHPIIYFKERIRALLWVVCVGAMLLLVYDNQD